MLFLAGSFVLKNIIFHSKLHHIKLDEFSCNGMGKFPISNKVICDIVLRDKFSAL